MEEVREQRLFRGRRRANRHHPNGLRGDDLLNGGQRGVGVVVQQTQCGDQKGVVAVQPGLEEAGERALVEQCSGWMEKREEREWEREALEGVGMVVIGRKSELDESEGVLLRDPRQYALRDSVH